MTTITVDSRKCGEGKTYDNSPTATYHQGRVLSTWSIIKQRWQLNDKCLVVLPSIALCEQYKEEFTQYINQNSITGWTNQLSVLTSADKDITNVQAKLHEELAAGCAIIIITQAAFLQSDVPSVYRQQYHLIIDEAIMPYREIAIYHEETCGIDFNWNDNTEIVEATDLAVEWP